MQKQQSNGAMVPGTNTPTVFSFGSNQLRTIKENGIELFMAQDVCKILDLNDTGKALSKLDDDEKLTRQFFGSGQKRNAYFITESGVFYLIFRSNKPEAKAFRKWVTSEVLPALRSQGSYAVQKAQDQSTQLAASIHNHVQNKALVTSLFTLADNIGRVSNNYRRTALLKNLNTLKKCLSL